MSLETLDECLQILSNTDIPTLDLTGGAPEMNPHFRTAVHEARLLHRHVIDRSNLTVFSLPRYADLPDFLAEQGVEIVASLPCYLEENVDSQRGDNAYAKSIAMLQRLNALGYGDPDSGLILTLVYNPVGPTLPPSQDALEEAYRKELATRHGIVFSRIFTMIDMPIGRFLARLIEQGAHESYMEKLIAAYNPAAAENVMCRRTLSVDWRGRLYDCDFNQAIDLPLLDPLPTHIRDFDWKILSRRRIATGQHCYGCTAGSGSSCQGATTV